MAMKAGECDMCLAVGGEKLAGAGLLGGGGGGGKSEEHKWQPSGRFGAVVGVDGRIGTAAMPGTFAQVGMEYLHENAYGGEAFELFAQSSAKNHKHSTRNPRADYTKSLTHEQRSEERQRGTEGGSTWREGGGPRRKKKK